MKKIFAVALGVLTAIGGFLDIGDLVTNAVVGSRFGLALAWVVPVGVLGICLYAQMAGRVAAVSGRATFEIIRERLGPRTAAANLGASFFINLMTVTAEIGGIALALQLASDVGPKLWIPVAAFGVWIVIWRVGFSVMENVTGLLGLSLIVFAVSVFLLHPDWSALSHQVVSPTVPETESAATYWYFAIALFGAAMTPYEVFFFSSGAVEEHWTVKDLGTSRLNVLAGFPLGGLLSVAIAAGATLVLLPAQIEVTSLSQVVMPVVAAGGKLALAFVVIGIIAATFGAALETTLSSGYTLAQFFGWAWGKFRRPAEAARFHTVMLVVLVACAAVLFTGVDPILVTEYSVVFSAIALPLTYLPILIVANDPGYMGQHVNGRATNILASVYLVIILAASLAAIPLMIVTGAGQ
jgi:Mn2+/Fe2+ NRAMP family transporter